MLCRVYILQKCVASVHWCRISFHLVFFRGDSVIDTIMLPTPSLFRFINGTTALPLGCGIYFVSMAFCSPLIVASLISLIPAPIHWGTYLLSSVDSRLVTWLHRERKWFVVQSCVSVLDSFLVVLFSPVVLTWGSGNELFQYHWHSTDAPPHTFQVCS